MKTTIALVSSLALAANAAIPSNLGAKFAEFKRKHGKRYGTEAEESRRFAIFKENMAFIVRHNLDHKLGRETFTVGVNQFADLTNSEYRSRHLAEMVESPNIRLNYQCPVNFQASGDELPESVDWRTLDNPKSTVAVTPVKNQGSCGSCWSFGTAATFEGAQCLAGNKDCGAWMGASEQQLVDCGGKDNTDLGHYYDMGCNGGWTDNGLYYIQQTGFLENYDDYPYTSGSSGKVGTCQTSSLNSAGSISNCGATLANSESDLKAGLAEVGPMGVAIDAGGLSFQLYSGGVYTSSKCSSTALNHAVTAVGYGVDASSGADYWIIKNSWGTGWGDNGYILMRRNYNNMCGVATSPAYAIV